jgi:hypothetical protein
LLKISRWLVVLGLFLAGVGGGFAPWVWRESVALQLTAPGLAEFVKFLPEVRTLQLQVARLHFLYPVFLAMIALPILVENKALQLPGWARWGLRLSVIPLALASLSPVWTPTILLNAEFRTQTLLAMVALSLTLIATLLKNLPLKIEIVLLMIGSLGAIVLPLWQFNLVQMAISAVYAEPVTLGWGWWLTGGAWP